MIADRLSQHNQVIQTEWSLHQEVFNLLCQRWHSPEVDLFATRYNNKLPKFVSPVPDPQAWALDALSFSCEDLDLYAFPPIPFCEQNPIPRLQKDNSHCPGLAQHALVLGSSGAVRSDPSLPASTSRSDGATVQWEPSQGSGWSEPSCLAPRVEASNRDSLTKWQQELRLLKDRQPGLSTKRSGPFLFVGASQTRWTSGDLLSNR